MARNPTAGLSAREREVMDIVYRLREVSAADVEREMEHPPSNATVRSILRTLEDKGVLIHGRDGARYVYRPAESRERAKKDALGHVVQTFFDGSVADAVTALLGRETTLSERERARVLELIGALEKREDNR